MSTAQRFAQLNRLCHFQLDDFVHCLSWSPDGQHVAVGLSAGKICLIRIADGKLINSWQAHAYDLMTLDWSQAEGILASGGQDGQVCFWDPYAGMCLFQRKYNNWIESLCFSPNGKWLAVATGRCVDLLDLQGNLLKHYADHSSTVSSLQWTADSKRVLSASYGQIRFLPLRGKEPKPLLWKTSLIALAMSPNARFLAAGTQDASIHFWPLPYHSGGELQMMGYPGKINQLAWDSEGRYLASNGRAEIIIWDTSGTGPANTKPCVLAPHVDKVTCFQFMPQHDLLASGDVAGTVRLCLLDESDPVIAQDELPGRITTLKWSPRKNFLVAGSSHGSVVCWKVQGLSDQLQNKVIQAWLN